MSATETHTQQSLADDPQMPRAGTLVGDRYEIQDVLGEGGFAVVYRAFDQRTKGYVAVKVLDPIMSRRKEFSSRFMREVETVTRLQHHNSISIFDAGETDSGCLFLVMELLEGRPLDSVLEDEGSLSYERVRNVAAQILKSLQEAHSKGIIHRDLKPANVFLADLAGERDYVKVLDFGIAKSVDESQDNSLTATGQVMCSPHYVAPERIKDHVTVPASDLYSLGVMMVELIEGKPPYEADSPMMLAVKHLSADPVPMGERTLAAPYAGVIQRACAKKIEDRYENALEMLDDLLAGRAAAPVTQAHAVGVAGQTMAAPPVQGANTGALHTSHEPDALMPSKSRAPLFALLALFVLAGLGAVFLIISGAEQVSEPPVAAAPTAPEPTAPEPIQPEPVAVPPVAPADPAANVRMARALVSSALSEGRAASVLALRAAEREAAEAALAAQVAAAERDAAQQPRSGTRSDSARTQDAEREARAAREREAAAAAEAEARREREARERAEREAREREAREAAIAAQEEERAAAEAERPRIRTNLAPRQ